MTDAPDSGAAPDPSEDAVAPKEPLFSRGLIAALTAAVVLIAVVVGLILVTTSGSESDNAGEGPAPTDTPTSTESPRPTFGPSVTPRPSGSPSRPATPLPSSPRPSNTLPSSAPPSTTPAHPTTTVDCPGEETVSSTDELETALAEVTAGSVIHLSPGVYNGRFVANVSGTPEDPIILCGGEDAVLDGGGVRKGYVLHLDGVANWVVSGFTIRNGQKGLMADGTTSTLIDGLSVSHTGDEAIHLRGFSSDNTVSNNAVSDTGLRKPKFGEGIYLGSAESNWCDVTGCQPDTSDRNVVRGNVISGTTSESVDIKEGTSDGVIEDNTFDGSTITAADSWVDVKGNGYLIAGNTGTNSPGDGFQTHEIIDGWGTNNVFRDNTAEVNGPGHGFALKPARGNVVACDNTATGGAGGLSNVSCTR